jgi:hypothetical protein
VREWLVSKSSLLALFIFSVLPLHGIDISLAPIVAVTDDSTIELTADEKRFGELYFDAIVKADSKNILQVKALDKAKLPHGKEIKSSLDALEICELYKIDYLVFGFFTKSYKTIEAEIRIFDKDRKEVRKTFYAKAEPGEAEQVRNDLAQRFVDYMYSIVGIEVKKTIPKVFRGFGGLELNASLGYWTPVGDWFNVYTGVVKADLGLLVHPEEELFWIGDFLFMYRFGLFLEYSLGLSNPDIELSSLHSAKASIPLECCMLFLERHAVYLGISVFYQHDFIYQVRIYGADTWLDSGTLGVGARVGYEYWAGDAKQYAFGGEAAYDISFYQNIFTQLSINIYFKYRFPFELKVRPAEEK